MFTRSSVIRLVGVTVTYALVAGASQQVIYSQTDVCALWPAAGVGLAGVLLWNGAGAVGTFLGSFAAVGLFFSSHLDGMQLLYISLFTAVGATTEAIAGALLVRHLLGGSDALLNVFRAQVAFGVVAAFCSSISALIGVGVRVVFEHISADDVAVTLLLWSVGDTLGILLVTPFAVALFRPSNAFPPVGNYEFALSALFTLASAAIVFLTNYPHPLVGCLFFLPILNSCFRMPQYWTLGTALVIGVSATHLTIRGFGPLVIPGDDELFTDLNLYPFIAATAITALTVSAGLQRRRSEYDNLERVLLENSPAGIAWSDEETRQLTRVSKQLVLDLGYASAEEMLAIDDIASAVYDDPNDRLKLLEDLRNSKDRRAKRKFVAKRKDGTKIWLDVVARSVLRGGRRQIIAFAREVTDAQRRLGQNELLGEVGHLLARTKVGNWQSSGLEIIRQKIEAGEVILWIVSEDRKTIERLWTHHGPGDKASFAISDNFPDVIKQLLDRPEYKIGTAYPLFSAGQFVAVIVALGSGWLFTDPKASQDGRAPLESLLTTAGQMIVEAILGDLFNERNKQFMELAEVGIFYADANGKNFDLNPKCREIQGMTSTGELGSWSQKLKDSDLVLGKWREYVHLVVGGASCKYELTQTFEIDNDIREVEVVARPVRVDGRLAGFVGVVHDITKMEDRRIEKELMLHAIDHDMKNSLVGLSDALEQIEGLLPTESRILTDVARTCHDDIKGLALQNNDGLEEFNCWRLPRSFQTMHANARQNVTVQISIDDDVPERVRGPRKEVSRALHNLVKNGVAFAGSKVDIRVSVRKSKEKTLLTFQIADDGSGLPLEVRQRLMWPKRPLQRWLVARKPGDHGRGLALSQLALLSIGSKILVEEGALRHKMMEGETTLRENQIRFEVEVTPLTDSQLKKNPPPDPMLLEGKGPVLLVDDLHYIRAGLAYKLLAWGIYPLVVCQSGDQAIDWVKQCQTRGFSLILMDINLGVMNGYEAVQKIREEIRKSPNLRASPPRILSISQRGRDEQKGNDPGFDGHIDKDKIDSPIVLYRLWFPDSEIQPSQPSSPTENNVVVRRRIPASTRDLSKLALLSVLANPKFSKYQVKFDNLWHQLRQQVSQWAGLLEGKSILEYAVVLESVLFDHLMDGVEHLTFA